MRWYGSWERKQIIIAKADIASAARSIFFLENLSEADPKTKVIIAYGPPVEAPINPIRKGGAFISMAKMGVAKKATANAV
jgi:hypothetical protein